MPKFSVKKPYFILVAVLALIVLGITGFTRMTTDFLPDMELPYMVIMTPDPGASPMRCPPSAASRTCPVCQQTT